MISTILMRITLFSYTIKEKLCRFETGSLNVFEINDVILNNVLATSYRANPVHQYEKSVLTGIHAEIHLEDQQHPQICIPLKTLLIN